MFVSFAGTTRDTLGFQCTPILPGTRWHVHDGLRPQPCVIHTKVGSNRPIPAPSDAIPLFNGTSLENFRMGNGKPATWKQEKGAMVVNNTGDIFTKDEFGDCQVHVEWATPARVTGSDQSRGNSGVWLMGRYEVQILDSYQNPTYPDGQAGAIYGQTPPSVNASRKPGEWQTFDIFFIAPRFTGHRLRKPAYITVIQNGIRIQNHVAIRGETVYMQVAQYTDFATKGPIKLQDHHCPVRFRNLWVRKLHTY